MGDTLFQEPTVNQYTTKRRTSVLYDFSYVQKARFYVYNVNNRGVIQIDRGTGGLLDVLYFQINPQTMKMSSDAARRITSPRDNVEGDNAELGPKGTGKTYAVEALTIPLIYNLYDEFSVGTMDGLLSVYCDDTDLMSTKATSLQRLIDLGRLNDVGVLFKWGTFKYFGAISSVNITYESFSRFGNPLTASGDITINAFGYHIDGNGEVIHGPNYDDIPKAAKDKINNIVDSADAVEQRALLAQIAAFDGALR